MNASILLLCGSLFYLILIIVIYFKQERINLFENKLYNYMLFICVFGILLDIFGIYAHLNFPNTSFIRWLIVKIYYLYLLAYIMLFTLYIVLSSFNSKYNKDDIEKYKKILIYSGIAYIILSIINFYLPFSYYNDGTIVYVYGLNSVYLYILTAICLITSLSCIYINRKYLSKTKYVPMLVLILGGIPIALLQLFYPYLLLITSLYSAVTILMYFTIENPDVKMLREFHKNKEYTENLNTEKSRFLFNMVGEVKLPLQKINRISKTVLMEDDIRTIKEEVSTIKYTSNNLIDLVDKVLDINNLEKRKISVRQSKYNTELLFKGIIATMNPRVKEKELEFITKYDTTIPINLYGDAVRVKQVINAVLEYSLENTEEGFIELDINSIVKHDNCRLVITIEDSSMGLEQEEVEKIFKIDNIEKDIEKIDEKDISIGLVKKILDMIGGTIIVNSELRKGNKFTIAIDQQIISNKKNKVAETLEKYEKIYLNNKRILLVINDSDLNKKIASMLKKYPIEVVSVTGGQACLEKIRNNELFDLIVMEDNLPKLSSEDTLYKLKQIDDFDLPVVMLTRKIELDIKKEYQAKGFTDTYIIPINKKSIDEIVHKYVLDED